MIDVNKPVTNPELVVALKVMEENTTIKFSIIEYTDNQ